MEGPGITGALSRSRLRAPGLGDGAGRARIVTNQSEWGAQPGYQDLATNPVDQQPTQPNEIAQGGPGPADYGQQQTPGYGIPQQPNPNSVLQAPGSYEGGQPPLVGQSLNTPGSGGPNRVGILVAILAVVLLLAVGLFFLLRPDGPRSGAADSGVLTNTTEGEEQTDETEPEAPSTEVTNSSTTESADSTAPDTTARATTTVRRTTASTGGTTATTRSTTTSESTTSTTDSTTTSEETTTTTESTTSSSSTTGSTFTTTTFDITIPTTLITIPRSTFSIAPLTPDP